MKPFDLEKAKAGKPVCTRNGHKARIICFDKIDSCYPIVALVSDSEQESICRFTNKGRKFSRLDIEDDLDLFMVTNNKEGWINIYKDKVTSVGIFSTKEDALKHRDPSGYIDTIKINWEE